MVVFGCGCFLLVVCGCSRLWSVVVVYGWLWLGVVGCGWLLLGVVGGGWMGVGGEGGGWVGRGVVRNDRERTRVSVGGGMGVLGAGCDGMMVGIGRVGSDSWGLGRDCSDNRTVDFVSRLWLATPLRAQI